MLTVNNTAASFQSTIIMCTSVVFRDTVQSLQAAFTTQNIYPSLILEEGKSKDDQ